MLNPIKSLFLLTLFCVSTAVVAAEMEYYPSKEQSVAHEGEGGLRKQYTGIDVWTPGAPPRRYVVVGKIYHSLGWCDPIPENVSGLNERDLAKSKPL